MSHDCGVYLPAFDVITIFHLKDLLNNKKTRIKGKNVVHLSVPQYENLKVDEFIAFANEHPKAIDHLPAVLKEIKKLPR